MLGRKITFFFQRLFRGWDDGDTFSLDHSLAKLILPRLKRFRHLHMGYPDSLSVEEWENILDQMIETFEYIASDKYFDLPDRSWKENNKIQTGLALFARYYTNLWW